MTELMIYLAKKFPKAKGLTQRALNQAARELLLAQQSDWAFMIYSGNASEYARKRFTEHVAIFNRIFDSIVSMNISENWLSDIENKDSIFKDIDYRIYQSKDY